ncbi:MAG: nucleotide exchange factor GrpE [Bacilli bacterium]|nr:nucleotide exchange factor GrpE [Bacilli bacterium]
MAKKSNKNDKTEEILAEKPEINEVMTDIDSEIESKNKEIEALKIENESLKKLSEDLSNKVKYTQAELINYRKRKDEEVEKIKKYCNQDIIVDLLPVIDNFERAVKYDDNNLDDAFSKFLSGFKLMFSDLNNVLVKYGVSEISRVGLEFDSKLEQALLTDNVKDKKDDEVLEVLLKGYMLHDRVIRPATVKINKIDE